MKKSYVFEVTIYEGSDEFWDTLKEKTGIDEVKEVLEEKLDEGFCSDNCHVKMLSFSR